MKPEYLPLIGTKFLLAVGALVVGTGCLGLGWIDGSTWQTVVLGTVGAFVVSNSANTMTAIIKDKPKGGER